MPRFSPFPTEALCAPSAHAAGLAKRVRMMSWCQRRGLRDAPTACPSAKIGTFE